MKLAVAFLLACAGPVVSFIPTTFSRPNISPLKSSAEECGVDLEHACGPDTPKNKAVGAGYSSFKPGYKELFDPELEGKLQETGDLEGRIQAGSSFITKGSINRYYFDEPSTLGASSPPESALISPCQDFLEYLDSTGEPPMNTYKPQAPTTATVLGVGKLIGEDAPGDIRHVLMELPDGFHYVEGQSLSVIPPGKATNGRAHKPRLYSIASTRYGDTLQGNTVSLCVRRAEFYDEKGNVVEEKKGVCSGFLCDLKKGDKVTVAGPVGKTMLLPPNMIEDSVPIIMIGTGTGVAPFRSFLHRMFVENTVTNHMYNGLAKMYLGVPTTSGLLYKSEFDYMERESGGRFKAEYAISREMENKDGGKMYVQHLLERDGKEIFDLIDGGAHVYFCGLKGMMPGILEAFEIIAGDGWDAKLKEWKKKGVWHVEVY
ncbi:hypothetical protein TrCOL_g3579 [Triparma columacea]|uniref:ferredoxin--NADP(+) reductase n=1 Tax=Triparma columacea TaxID=722753 RepID=A0A9W7GD39_9STRA|nr:hypothetical protein TrCOL_g3579 [Triparma columacea]